ncbi:YbbR-like domain-containing protein [Ichthyobacterium seriolicida]|uniref:YbbR-like domain-containing protein n=1 Tax=Ichthyobacterium seriolicida TaxID=242600 RepID=A0A1J1E2Q9_9FLAO|nr:hypothetical protein [Ichthyobacterium seriolicida]BAV94316.1 hypothetical protein JBKA6_0303 [Ichthyobacterium seriolicida]
MIFLKKDKNDIVKQRKVIAICISVSIFFWVFTKFPKNYTNDITFNVTYTDLPKDKILKSGSIENVTLKIYASGFSFYSHHFSSSPIVLSLKDLKEKNKKNYILLSDNFRFIEKQLGYNEQLIQLQTETDTIWLDLYKKTHKKIPVQIDKDISFLEGYQFIKPMSVTPKEITVSGSQEDVDKINEIAVEKLIKYDINSNFKETLNIIPYLDDYVEYSHNKVLVKGEIDKVTQIKMEVPVRVINVPDSSIYISLFPDKVTVYGNVPISKYKKTNVSDFEVTVNFAHHSNRTEKLIPELTKSPEYIINPRLTPNSVQYIIKK